MTEATYPYRLHPFLQWAIVSALIMAASIALPLSGILPNLPIADLFATEAALVSSFITGRRLLVGPLKASSGEAGVETVVGIALGFGALSTIFFFMALFGPLGRAQAWIALLTPPALSLIKSKNTLLAPIKRSGEKAPPSLMEYTILGFTLLFIAVTLQMTLTPPTARDSLIHHLAIPKIYITQGKMVDIPFSVYSYYPMNFNMLYMWGMLVSTDITAKLLHFSTYGLTCLAIFAALSRYYQRPYAYLGALLFSSIPVVVNVASWAYVDLALTFYAVSSFLALDLWAHGSSHKGTGENGFLWASAFLAGFAMATKYNGLILFFLALMATLYLAQLRGRGTRGCLLVASVFAALALLAASPWFIRDLALTGNPIYPLFSNVLGEKEWQPERVKLPGIMVRRVLHQESWLDDLLIPLKVSLVYRWNDFNTDGPLGPVLLSVPLLIFFRRKPRAISVAGGIALVYYAFALMGSGIRLRYFIPALPFLVLLSVHGLWGLGNTGRWWGKCVMGTAVSLILAFNFYLILPLYSGASPMAFLSGHLDRNTYLRVKIHDYDAYEFINRKLPSNARVMFLYTGNDGYYLDRQYFYDSYYLGYTIKNILQKVSNGGQVAYELKKMGITHLFINWYFLQLNFQVSVSPEQMNIFREFAIDYLYPMYVTGDEVVYALKGIGD